MNISKDFIETEYKNKGINQIAKDNKKSAKLIRKLLIEYGIKIRPSNKNRHKDINLIGMTFSDWKVIGEGKDKFTYLCECQGCKKQKLVRTNHLISGASKLCKSCCHKGSKSTRWKGCGEITGSYWSRLLIGAEKRKIIVTISIEHLWELFLIQGKRCMLSKLPISFSDKTASVDRIDSDKGYIEGNIQWVHKTVNKMKNDIQQEEFIKLCKLITINQNI
jgi:hypothetical protein